MYYRLNREIKFIFFMILPFLEEEKVVLLSQTKEFM